MSPALSGAVTIAREMVRCGVSRAVTGRLPDRAERVTAPWLASVLGREVRSVSLLSQDSGTAARARIALDAEPGRVFVKLTPRDVRQQLLMNVVGLGHREVLFYRAVAADVPIRVPRCYAAFDDPALGRIALVLEDLTGKATFRDVRDDVSVAEAGAVVDAFADLHAALWESPRLTGPLAALGPLRRSPVVGVFGRALVRRALARPAAPVADLVPAALARRSRVVTENLEAIDDFWAAQPRTLTHGDPHLGNLFFEGASPGFLDWQVATICPGIRDVAYFLVTSLTPANAREHERRLVDRYGERLAAAGITSDPDTLWTSYRAIAAEAYIAALATAGAGERMQPRAVARSGVARASAAVQALDTFDAIADLVGLRRG
ncbi:phosphotransferase family protein [Cryptosporangium arvum]|uniref:phosphotransferase family protein n=1 Tax=Cryptosporangium arvum TaxID=80871 RepID=UPI0004B3FC90|nr:aminoglycoside phosphotransferase family protein [Cryptosporangium arvum]